MATKQQLVKRWKSGVWSERNAAVQRWSTGIVVDAELITGKLVDLWPLLEGLPFREEVASGWDLRASGLYGLTQQKLDGFDASYCRELTGLRWCVATDCKFDGAGPCYNLFSRFLRCSFRGARLRKADLAGSFIDCCFDGAQMSVMTAFETDFRGSSFRGAMLRTATFTGSDLRGCDFTDADLSGACLSECTLDATTVFRGARLVNVGTEARDGSHINLRAAQIDARTRFGDDDTDYWKAHLSGVMHYLKGYRDRPWAPVVREIIERTRQQLVGPDADLKERWVDEIRARVAPEHRDEVEGFLEEATTKAM